MLMPEDCECFSFPFKRRLPTATVKNGNKQATRRRNVVNIFEKRARVCDLLSNQTNLQYFHHLHFAFATNSRANNNKPIFASELNERRRKKNVAVFLLHPRPHSTNTFAVLPHPICVRADALNSIVVCFSIK